MVSQGKVGRLAETLRRLIRPVGAGLRRPGGPCGSGQAAQHRPGSQLVKELGVDVKELLLVAGQVIDGEGGYCVWGRLTTADAAVRGSLVPLGLLEGARLVRDVPRGAAITSDDIELDGDPLVLELRNEMVSLP